MILGVLVVAGITAYSLLYESSPAQNTALQSEIN
jgi:hypothetical protein